ncbi:MAG: DUF4395 domain-containing protein [Actinomycetota bacterium]
MATRMIDRNGHRWGAGISAVVLVVAYVTNLSALVMLIWVALGIGTFFGLRYSPLGATYRIAKKALKLNIPVVPEDEPPPRFAQLMGFAMLSLSAVGFYLLDNRVMGWTFAIIVAALQTLLAVTGLCVGCEMYLFGKRLTAKGAA